MIGTYTTPIANLSPEWLAHRLSLSSEIREQCLVWVGYRKDGYGILQIANRKIRVHRIEWERHHGPIPKGMGVLHSCDNRACRNIDHLFIGDAIANNADRDSKGRGSAGKREMHGSAKLTEDNVRAIKDMAAEYGTLSAIFDVSISTIKKIKRRHTWVDDYPIQLTPSQSVRKAGYSRPR